MTWREREVVVSRTARYYTLGPAGPELAELWLVCHGYGQLAARFARPFEELPAADRRCVVAPEGLSRFYTDPAQREKVGASWMTREHRLAEISDYVAYLDAVCDEVLATKALGVRLTALGFSQGASTVSRWAALGRHPVHRLILWGGELPPDLDLEAAAARFAALEVIVVRGKRDKLITEKTVAGIVRRLERHKVRHRVVEFEGGHEIDGAVLGEIAAEDGGRR